MEIMTVGEAIRNLQEFDPDLPFVLSSDEEGNNIRIVNGIGNSQVAELRYNYMDSVHPDDADEYDNLIQVVEVW